MFYLIFMLDIAIYFLLIFSFQNIQPLNEKKSEKQDQNILNVNTRKMKIKKKTFISRYKTKATENVMKINKFV